MGGGLIAASFLVAVLLNRSVDKEPVPVEREPPADVCKDPPEPGPLAPGTVPGTAAEECKRVTESLQR